MQRRILNLMLATLMTLTLVPVASAQTPAEELLALMGAANADLEAVGANIRIEVADTGDSTCV